jgi:hypothetical protein
MKKFHELVTECAADAQNPDRDYWTTDDWVAYANDGRAQMMELKPRLYLATEPMSLAAGFDQALPDGSRKLFDIVRNISHISNRAISLVSEELLSRSRPNWRGEAPADRILHFMYDEQKPSGFRVYPSARAGTQVEIMYAKPPTLLTAANGAANASGPSIVELTQEGDQYVALKYFMMSRAYLKGANSSPGYGAKATAWMEMFQASFLGESAAITRNSPNQNKKSGPGPTNKQP